MTLDTLEQIRHFIQNEILGRYHFHTEQPGIPLHANIYIYKNVAIQPIVLNIFLKKMPILYYK